MTEPETPPKERVHSHFITPRSCAFADRAGNGWIIGDDMHMNGLDAPLRIADEDAALFIAWVRGLFVGKKELQP